MIRKNVAIFVSGRGSNMEALIDKSAESDCSFRVALVISDKREAPALNIASKLGIKALFIDPKKFKNKKNFEETLIIELKKENCELIVLAGYMRIVGKTLLKEFHNRILNIHPSLLPSFKGLNVHKRALDYGVKYSGCTVHLVVDDIDAGAIIGQKAVEIFEDDTEESLSKRILEEEHKILPQIVNQFCMDIFRIDERKVRTSDVSNCSEPDLLSFYRLHYGDEWQKEVLRIKEKSDPIGVSACLLGIPCRYDGNSKKSTDVSKMVINKNLLPVCPEVLSRFSIPRPPMEYKKGDGKSLFENNGQIANILGVDTQKQLKSGSELAFKLIKMAGIKEVILKSRSPSCGVEKVYLNGKIVDGIGSFAYILKKNGINIKSDEMLKEGEFEY